MQQGTNQMTVADIHARAALASAGEDNTPIGGTVTEIHARVAARSKGTLLQHEFTSREELHQ
jgi:hypothetical protein